MTFTALVGSVSHVAISSQIPDLTILITCVISTFIFARIAAVIANKASARTLNIATGIVLVTISIAVIIMTIVQKFVLNV